MKLLIGRVAVAGNLRSILNHVGDREELLNGATEQVRILNESINDNAVGFLQAKLFLNDSAGNHSHLK
nr:MAG TPA: hypothetical protein [Caudoviricetes sp.]